MLKCLKCKKSILLVCVLMLVSKLSALDVEYIHPFKLSPVNDSIQLSTSFALAGSGLLCDKVFKIKDSEFNPDELDRSEVAIMDQIFMQSYNKAIDYVGTGFTAAALLTPLVFAAVPNNEWLTLGVMYGEALMYAYGFKQWGKLIVNRARPYMYFNDYPESKVEDGDWNCSMPSGHTTYAFTGAAFASYVFCQYFPDSYWRYGVVGVSFGLAVTTAALRMASGNHYFSDVMVGAVIGTTCGFVVPFLHSTDFYKRFEKKNDNVEIALTPVSFTLCYKF